MTLKPMALCVIMLAVLGVGPGLPAMTRQAQISYRFYLTPESPAHSPIYLRYVIENASQSDIVAGLGFHRIATLTITVTHPDGSVTPGRPIPTDSGLTPHPEITLKPGARYEHRLLLSEWVDLSTPGVYRVSIGSNAVFRSVETNVAVPVQRNWETVLRISPTTEQEVRKLCAKLDAQADGFSESARTALRELAAIRHPLTVPYLVRHARGGNDPDVAIDGLGLQLENPAAKSALEDIVRENPRGLGGRAASVLRRGGK